MGLAQQVHQRHMHRWYVSHMLTCVSSSNMTHWHLCKSRLLVRHDSWNKLACTSTTRSTAHYLSSLQHSSRPRLQQQALQMQAPVQGASEMGGRNAHSTCDDNMLINR
jgi:hypothetical protein